MNLASQVIRLDGVLDPATYLEIDRTIVERVFESFPMILLDMRSLKKLSPKTVSPLLRRARWMRAYGSELRLAGARPPVKSMLKHRDEEGALKLFATPREALKAQE